MIIFSQKQVSKITDVPNMFRHEMVKISPNLKILTQGDVTFFLPTQIEQK